MDPLSITGSLLAILHTATLLLHHLSSIKNASREQVQFAIELSRFKTLVDGLKYRVERANSQDVWFRQIQSLGSSGGPIDQVDDVLNHMQSKIQPRVTAAARAKARLTWNFKKKEIQSALGILDRFVSSANLALQDDAFKLTLEIKSDSSQIADSVQQVLADKKKNEYEAAVDWLRPPDPSPNHHRARQKHLKQSCAWFINIPQFADWLKTPSCLWLHGKPGSGKTIISSTVIEHVRSLASNDTERLVAYFYFEFGHSPKQQTADLLRSLLVQLAHHNSEDMDIISRLHSRHRVESSSPSEDELHRALLDVSATKNHIYIILDGLDEVSSSAGVAKLIRNLINREQNTIHVFLASRPERDIKDELDLVAPNQLRQIKLSPNHVADDIHNYIKDTVAHDKAFQKWPSTTQKLIVSKLTEKSNGMFQWVYCQLEELRKCVSNSMVKKTLATLPKSLKDTYSRIFQRIQDQGHTTLVIRALQVMLCSYRELRLAEIVEFLAIELGDNAYFSEEERLPDHNDVFLMCRSLITISPDPEYWVKGQKYATQEHYDLALSKGPEITISHISVAEYLSSHSFPLRNSLLPNETEYVTAHCCLTYLLHLSDLDASNGDWQLQYPLATYAARFWAGHLNSLDQQKIPEALIDAALKLIRDHPRGLKTWRSFADLDSPRFRDLSPWLRVKATTLIKALTGYEQTTGTAFYYACLTGNIEIVRRMMVPGMDLNEFQGGLMGYAYAAAISSNTSLPIFLALRGASVFPIDRERRDLATVMSYERLTCSPYEWC